MIKVRRFSLVFSVFSGFSLSSLAAVPADWISESAVPSASQDGSGGSAWTLGLGLNGRGEPSDGARDFDRYFVASETMANAPAARSSKQPWYLQSIKAELGIEASGEVGFLGLSGEAAVELIWTRKKAAVSRLVQEVRGAGSQALVSGADLSGSYLSSTAAAETEQTLAQFDSAMSVQALEEETAQLADALARNPAIRKTGALRAELQREIRRVLPVVQTLASAPADWSWVPYKFQLELFVQAEGHLSPVVVLGAVTRLRLEWSITRKPKAITVPSGSALAGYAQLLRSLDDSLARSEENQKLFKLAAVKLGVGLGGELELGVAEIKGHALGAVFLKRVAKAREKSQAKPEPMPLVLASTAASAPLSIVRAGGADPIPAEKLSTAISKALRIASAITERAEKHERKRESKLREFELGAIEVELSLTATGGVHLPTVSHLAAAELFFVRGGVL